MEIELELSNNHEGHNQYTNMSKEYLSLSVGNPYHDELGRFTANPAGKELYNKAEKASRKADKSKSMSHALDASIYHRRVAELADKLGLTAVAAHHNEELQRYRKLAGIKDGGIKEKSSTPVVSKGKKQDDKKVTSSSKGKEPPLTKEQRLAAYSYTETTVQSDIDLTRVQEDKLMHEAIASRAPLPKGTTLYRGLGFKDEGSYKAAWGAFEGALRSGASVHLCNKKATMFSGIISTTTDSKVADQYANDTGKHASYSGFCLRIKARTGMDVTAYSDFDEQEIVLDDKLSKFRVTGVDKKNKIIDIKEV